MGEACRPWALEDFSVDRRAFEPGLQGWPLKDGGQDGGEYSRLRKQQAPVVGVSGSMIVGRKSGRRG